MFKAFLVAFDKVEFTLMKRASGFVAHYRRCRATGADALNIVQRHGGVVRAKVPVELAPIAALRKHGQAARLGPASAGRRPGRSLQLHRLKPFPAKTGPTINSQGLGGAATAGCRRSPVGTPAGTFTLNQIIRADSLARSRRIATNLDVGVLLPSPMLSSGTSGFTSG